MKQQTKELSARGVWVEWMIEEISNTQIQFSLTIATISSIYRQNNICTANHLCFHFFLFFQNYTGSSKPVIKCNNCFYVRIRTQSTFWPLYGHGCRCWWRSLQPSLMRLWIVLRNHWGVKHCMCCDRSCVKGHRHQSSFNLTLTALTAEAQATRMAQFHYLRLYIEERQMHLGVRPMCFSWMSELQADVWEKDETLKQEKCHRNNSNVVNGQ